MKIEKEILYRYFNGDATPEEEHKIRQYLEASDENWKEYLRERKFFDTIILKEQVVSEEKQMKRRQLIRKISLECLKVAAVLLIAFGTAFFWNNQSEKPATKSVVNTLKGQMANITLPDGSRVWLNSNTRIEYSQHFDDKREVQIDGEAYFEGAKNKEIPFYVNTETNQVRVVGTHFNVCAYKGSNEFETTLVEGIVDIYAYDNERPLTRLTKNEFFGSYQGKYKKAVLPSYDYLRWREGLYCFDGSPFSCILTKLEKYYNVKITVENPKVLNYRCTGKFKEQDGVEHILKVIQKDHPFTYSISEEGDSIRIE